MTARRLKKEIEKMKNWKKRDYAGERTSTGEKIEGKIAFIKNDIPIIQPEGSKDAFMVKPKSVTEIKPCSKCKYQVKIVDYVHIKCVGCRRNNFMIIESDYFELKEG